MSVTRVIAITGCDSGLGWAIAARAAREGLITVAGMYNGTDTEAAKALKKLCAYPCPLDVTKQESVIGFRDYVKELLRNNPDWQLYAVVNNAGIMTIGEYEWQTPTMIENTINVNLLGAMRVVSAFLPDLRQIAYNSTSIPRIINVTSHCGLQPLPGFGPYSATKAGLQALTRALRYEYRSHGISAVAFIPGGFIGSSNLLSGQATYGKEMLNNLNEEQKQLYEVKIKTLIDYLKPTTQNTNFDSLNDENIIETFMKTLTDKTPKELYKVESWRYKFYYALMKLPFPEVVQQWIVKKFLNFPA